MKQNNTILTKRARAKYISSNLSHRLALNNPDSPLLSSYRNSFYCSDVFVQTGKTLTTTYCKNRWCATCNRIRTARLINGYLPVINSMKDPYFITLTLKTVYASDLPFRIDYMIKAFRCIIQSRKGREMRIRGVRKLECTLRPDQKFHPHFHLIVESEEAAQFILSSWVALNDGLVSISAQDIRRADEKSLKELFKYFTKLVSPGSSSIDYKNMDVVFRSTRNRRIYQPFGGIKPVSEDIEKIESVDFDTLDICEDLWKWNCNDWFSHSSGEALANYSPSEGFSKVF